MGGVTGAGRAALSQGGERTAAGGIVDHAASVFCAAVVQPERSGGGALYESPVRRRFAGVDLGRAPAPDESTILQFRHLLEKHDVGGAMLQRVNEYLESRGIRISRGTIVDATILHAPSSTKNRSGERDPEMHQTRKGKQWYFGLKAHIGVDSKRGHVHSVCTSAASVADKHMLPGPAAR